MLFLDRYTACNDVLKLARNICNLMFLIKPKSDVTLREEVFMTLAKLNMIKYKIHRKMGSRRAIHKSPRELLSMLR